MYTATANRYTDLWSIIKALNRCIQQYQTVTKMYAAISSGTPMNATILKRYTDEGTDI